MDFLPVNFQLPVPSVLTGQTDGQTTTVNALRPTLWGQRNKITEKITTVHYLPHMVEIRTIFYAVIGLVFDTIHFTKIADFFPQQCFTTVGRG